MGNELKREDPIVLKNNLFCKQQHLMEIYGGCAYYKPKKYPHQYDEGILVMSSVTT